MESGSPHNILLVHTRYRLPGGEDAMFEAERDLLAAHGHHVVCYERANAEADGSLRRKLLLPFTAVYSFKTAREVRALIARENIELVHVHNTLLMASPSVFTACRRAGVPAVQTLHNFRLFCPNGILLRDGAVCEDCPARGLGCAVRHGCYRGSRAQSLVCAAVYKIHRWLGTYRHVTLIALTPFDKQKLDGFNARRRVYAPEKMFVKPNFVALPPALAAQPPRPWAARKNQIVFAGRLEELKGLRTAIEAWRLLEPLPGCPKLILAGSGPLEGWARQNAGPHVELAGQLPKAALLALLAESRAALAPSLCYESFALVPAEAHAVGTPVLASDIGNVGAAVRPGVDGFTFAPGDAAALAAAVQKLAEAGPSLDFAAMRQAALAAFAPEQNYTRLMEIYQKAREGTPR